MNPRPLQPGDLCWILCADITRQGHYIPTKQCLLNYRYAPGVEIIVNDGTLTSTEEAWQVTLVSGENAAIGTRYLMRIDGNPDAETLEQNVKEEVGV